MERPDSTLFSLLTSFSNVVPIVQQTTFAASNNNTSVVTCDPILMQNNATIDYGICPETLVNQVICCIFLGFYILFILFTALGLIITRNVPLVKNRSVVVLIISLFTNSALTIVYMLRMSIGRRIYPCFIYMLIQSIGPQIVLGPTFLRLWRMMWLSKLNKARVLIVKTEEESMLNNTNQTEQTNRYSSAQQPLMGESPSVSSNIEMIDTNKSVKSEKNTSQQQITSLKKRIYVMQQLTSWWFYMLFTIFFLFISLLVWMFGGLLEIYDLIPLRFSRTGDFFTWAHGCSNGMGMIILLVVEVVVYLIAIGILLIFTLREDKDTWSLRLEFLILSISWLLWVVLYLVAGLIPQITSLTDAYFTYGYNVFFGMFLDSFITAFVPVVRAFFYRKPSAEGNFSELLDDEKMFEVLMDFAKKSYCVEAPLCYKEVLAFKSTTNASKRREMATNIYKNYLKQYAPLELNLPSRFRDESILSAIMDLSTPLPVTFFDELLTHCENDMTDVINRCCKQNKEMNELVRKITK